MCECVHTAVSYGKYGYEARKHFYIRYPSSVTLSDYPININQLNEQVDSNEFLFKTLE